MTYSIKAVTTLLHCSVMKCLNRANVFVGHIFITWSSRTVACKSTQIMLIVVGSIHIKSFAITKAAQILDSKLTFLKVVS